MNHSRCCANDNGNACSRAARSSAGIFRPPLFSLLTSSICFPSPATVGFSNRLLNPTSTPSTLLTRDTTCVASNECPPNSKKFSSLPTRSRFNTCAHTPATNSSVAVLAPPSPLPPSPSLPSPISSVHISSTPPSSSSLLLLVFLLLLLLPLVFLLLLLFLFLLPLPLLSSPRTPPAAGPLLPPSPPPPPPAPPLHAPPTPPQSLLTRSRTPPPFPPP